MARSARRLTITISTALIGAFVMTAAQAGTFVYVGNAESSDVHVFALDPSGGLAEVQKVPIPGLSKAGSSTPMALSPDKRVLHVGTRGEPLAVSSFAIDPKTGKLAHVGNATLPDSMAYVATDRSGRFLLSASYGGHKVAVSPIDEKGQVGPATQVVATAPNAHAIVADPANRHVLATSLGGDVVNQFRFDAATGKLSPNDPPAAKVKDKAGPRHFVFHPGGKLVYLLNELDASVVAFDYDAEKGQLKEKQVISALPAGFDGKPWAADLQITPDGRFLYASERTSSTLAAFKVDPAGGTLTLVGHYPTEKQPRAFAIDPGGRYLLAVGQLSHGLSVYGIDQESGKLAKLKEYPMGKNPNWVEIVSLP
jgi:6-phosphogluconolactonase